MGHALSCKSGFSGAFQTPLDTGGKPVSHPAADDEAPKTSQVGERISRGGNNSFALPQSPIWRFQKQYYLERGPKSWTEGIVPSFVSCNAFLAAVYARTIVELARVSPKPVVVLEIGSGSGKLMFHIAKRIAELRKAVEIADGSIAKVVCVITDFNQGMLSYWRNHPSLKELLASGDLDLAVLNAEEESLKGVTLEVSGTRIEAGTHSVVAICNYLLDTLVQDLFQFTNKGMHRACLELSFPNPKVLEEIALTDIAKHAELIWTYDLCEKKEDELLAEEMLPFGSLQEKLCIIRILRNYVEAFAQESSESSPVCIPVPLGAIRLIRNLYRLSTDGDLLLLCGDKGYGSLEELKRASTPAVAIHGSFSFMANFDLLASFLRQTYHNVKIIMSRNQEGFKTFGVLFRHERQRHLNVESALDRLHNSFSPEDFASFQHSYKEHVVDGSTASLQSVLATMKLASHDPGTFLALKKAFVEKSTITCSNAKEQCQLKECLEIVWDNYFPLQSAKDVAFEQGRVLMAINEFEQALSRFSTSQRDCGSHYATALNMGICNYHLNRIEPAREALQRALELDKTSATVHTWLAKVKGSS